MRYRHLDSEIRAGLEQSCPQESRDLYIVSAALDYSKKEVAVVLLDGTEFRVPFNFFTGEKSYSEWIQIESSTEPDFTRISVGDLGRTLNLGSFSIATEAMTVPFLGKDPEEIMSRTESTEES